MSIELDSTNLPLFPKGLPEKIRTIRERLGLTPDEIAPKVGAHTGAEIIAYENDGMIYLSAYCGATPNFQETR